MHTITIDFETFYSKTYTLKNTPTQMYVRSPLFEAIGVSIQIDDGIPDWFSGLHHEIKDYLLQFDWANSLVIGHNLRFDASILEWIFDIHPKKYFCTLQAARPLVAPFSTRGKVSLSTVAGYYGLGKKGTEVMRAIGMRRMDFTAQQLHDYGEYCKNDTALCYQAYLKMAPHLPVDEQDMIHETILKMVRPKAMLDRDVLAKRLNALREEKALTLFRAGLSDNKILMSNPQFALALQDLGVEPPTKISPATNKETWAFARSDPEFKALLEHDDPQVQTIMAARFKHKSTMEEKRLENFLALSELNTPVAIPLTYYGAHTGRLSGADGLNFQNLPRGGELRRALVAPEGYAIVAGDLSQIEARIVAYLAGQQDLVDAFARGDDVYCVFASILYNKKITKADFEERFVGKTGILGLGYGLGHEKFCNTLHANGIELTHDEAKRIVRTYRKTYHLIPELWKAMDTALLFMAANAGFIKLGPLMFGNRHCRLPNGMSIFYPELKREYGNSNSYIWNFRGNWRNIWGGGLTENVVQALARIVLAIAELRLSRRGLHAALQIHDELLYCVRLEHVEAVKKALTMALTAPVSFMPGLPVACEVKSGANYAEAK